MTNLLKQATFCQKIVYDSIIKFYNENEYMPTIRELLKLCGLNSTETVYKHLHNLEKLGYIEINGKKRGIILK